ncbi:MAG: response regulator transcription factor [Deltaproteobacteria bacterium]|nr:response regulator transcription factor [Deltaproteobacteria bacterium]MBK8714849.1 response regulator transcription factor [Deltaproteobacteria bacterium]MBP7287382.1 response regulator transcription factor [Nannocystaceae bacterium]
MSLRVLLIDDDERLFELLARYMGDNDVVLTHAADGARGLAALAAGGFDVILLDVMMPRQDGISVLKKIRERDAIPIVMLTAKGDEADRVVGLELGADDYVAKPFSPRELLARLRAVTRRGQPGLLSERLSAGGIVIDVGTRQVTREGRVIELTAVEFDILVALMRRAGRVVPRTALLSEAGRGDVNVGERTIDVHISRLRRQIGDDPKAATRIQTIRGVGYMLTREGEE